jgi:hypothetical protein
MATVEMAWHTGVVPSGTTSVDPREYQGYDVHVVRGSSSLPLQSILLLVEETKHIVRADSAQLPPDVTGIAFVGGFEATIAGGVATGGGVRLDMRTGAVEALPNPDARRLRSFLVTPSVQRVVGGPLSGPPVRFHIHESVTRIWLTPSPLTLPADGDGHRLSVLARFDDDTVGDITHLAGAPTAPGQPPVSGFAWTSSDNTIVRADGRGRLSGVFGLSPASATVTATLRQPGWPTLSADAQVTVIEPWGERRLSTRELHLVAGPGAQDADQVPNILFLPDGFLDTAQDRGDFDKLVALAVHRLNHSASTTPFDVLSGSINYWSVFVPSRERGTTTLSGLVELAILREGPGHLFTETPVTRLSVDGLRPAGVRSIDFSRDPVQGWLQQGITFMIDGDPTRYVTTNVIRADANAVRGVQFEPALTKPAPDKAAVTLIWRSITVDQMIDAVLAEQALPWREDLRRLVRTVGLPVPAERLTRAPTPAELQAKVADWVALYGAQRIQPGAVTDLVYGFWARWLADRRLADEKDTAFGLAIGGRPNESRQPPSHNLTWHPLHTNRTDVDRLLATLEFNGTVVGPTWAVAADGTPGKDRTLVFVLANGARFSGANGNDTPQPIIAIGLSDERNVRVRYGTDKSVQIEPHPLVRTGPAGEVVVTNYLHATIAHETAHSYGILDEYGGSPSLPIRSSRESDTLTYGNVTPLREVISAGGGIGGDQLRWRWPRIRKAGVLAGPPEPAPGIFTIRLSPGHQGNIPGDDFEVGDVVHLRQRPLLRTPAGTPPALNPARQSPPLTVISARQVAGQREFQIRLRAGTLDPTDYAATGAFAPVMLAPVPAPVSAAGDPYAELMSRVIRTHITTTRRPLNAAPGPPQPPQCVPVLAGNGHLEAQPAINLPPAAAFPGGHHPAFPLRIVGAYDGGGTFNCGIYHPTGACMMRSQLAVSTERPLTSDAEGDVHAFCTVCRYLLVDAIDPRLHWLIDAFYHDYPQP